jgi:hypothetical protein
MSEAGYRLTVREGVSTVHRWPAFEECNLDDTEADISVDTSTAAHLIDKGEARPCEHCRPMDIA